MEACIAIPIIPSGSRLDSIIITGVPQIPILRVRPLYCYTAQADGPSGLVSGTAPGDPQGPMYLHSMLSGLRA